jgi:pimeloyl-ACP methyl ester carboxylesterase
MHRLGYRRYAAQGGDQGAAVTDTMARQAPERLAGIHLNFLRTALTDPSPGPEESDEERAAVEAIASVKRTGFGYFLEQTTRPQTIGYALLDSPVALASWMLDHDTDSYSKISRAFVDGEPSGNLSRDNVLDNITLYWVTNTAVSSARLYWESKLDFFAPKHVNLPTAISVFPDEIYAAPQSWAEQAYPNLIHYNRLDKGGHFAAWEEPELFATELRAGFRSLR